MKKLFLILSICVMSCVVTQAQTTMEPTKKESKTAQKKGGKKGDKKGPKKDKSDKPKGGGDGIDNRMKGPNGEPVIIGKKGGRYYMSPTGEKVYLQRGKGHKKGKKK
jgi:hypothetical protein